MTRISTRPRPAANPSALRFGTVRQWLAGFSLPMLSMALFVGAAAAQTASGPIVDGRRPQPTQQQIDKREGDAARLRDRAVQPEVDRLYDDILRASEPRAR